MLRLPGEDAIIGWPNAKATIIDLRDKYMARTLHAAATGNGAISKSIWQAVSFVIKSFPSVLPSYLVMALG